MLRVALTGGIATGKTHVLDRFHALGVPTLDADRLARDAVNPGEPAWHAVVQRFGRDIVQDDESLDRKALAATVFGDIGARRDLEAIVHPVVHAAIDDWSDDLARRGVSLIAVVDIPLLFESGRAGDFDRVVVTYCVPERQLARVQHRDGLTAHEAAQRIEAQWPSARKVEHADYVIDTQGSLAQTDRQVEEIYGRLVADARRA